MCLYPLTWFSEIHIFTQSLYFPSSRGKPFTSMKTQLADVHNYFLCIATLLLWSMQHGKGTRTKLSSDAKLAGIWRKIVDDTFVSFVLIRQKSSTILIGSLEPWYNLHILPSGQMYWSHLWWRRRQVQIASAHIQDDQANLEQGIQIFGSVCNLHSIMCLLTSL
jgi:hypothetical protein